MKTIDVRVLVNDDVDEQFFVEQLVQVAKGPGAPRGAVALTVEENPYENGCGDDIVPTDHVVVHLGYDWWNGESVDASTRTPRDQPTQVERVQELARELYPAD